jgi:predicted metal-dependent HD superfamily phosphohydrolase
MAATAGSWNVRQRWEQCWKDLFVPLPAPYKLDELVAAYTSPDRHYHTLEHVLDCLQKLDQPEVETENRAYIQAAIWFHDAVYDSHASDNERLSADLAHRSAFEAGVATDVCRSIADLVLATDHRTEPSSLDARVICDIDLSILGESEEQFRRYDWQIAQEYSWVTPEIYRKKRSAVLESFLRRPRIYRTDLFYAEYEAAARRNLEALLREMRG